MTESEGENFDGGERNSRTPYYCTWDYLIPQAMSRRPLKEKKEKERKEEGIVIHLIGDPQTRSAAVSSLCSLQAE